MRSPVGETVLTLQRHFPQKHHGAHGSTGFGGRFLQFFRANPRHPRSHPARSDRGTRGFARKMRSALPIQPASFSPPLRHRRFRFGQKCRCRVNWIHPPLTTCSLLTLFPPVNSRCLESLPEGGRDENLTQFDQVLGGKDSSEAWPQIPIWPPSSSRRTAPSAARAAEKATLSRCTQARTSSWRSGLARSRRPLRANCMALSRSRWWVR